MKCDRESDGVENDEQFEFESGRKAILILPFA